MWGKESWKSKEAAQSVSYPDSAKADRAMLQLSRLPPLVHAHEVSNLLFIFKYGGGKRSRGYK